MKRKAVLGAVAAALALAMAYAQAAPDDKPGWCAGIDLTRSNLGLSTSGIDSALANQGIAGSTSISTQDTGVGLNLGYRFSRSFTLEGGYIDLGRYNYGTLVTGPPSDTVQGVYKAHAFSISAVRILPMNQRWSLYGKAGLARISTDLGAASLTGATTLSNVSGSNYGWLLGVGATYDFAGNWFGKTGWDRYAHVGDPSGSGRRGINVFSLGMGVRF